jgi:hypothetical protein
MLGNTEVLGNFANKVSGVKSFLFGVTCGTSMSCWRKALNMYIHDLVGYLTSSNNECLVLGHIVGNLFCLCQAHWRIGPNKCMQSNLAVEYPRVNQYIINQTCVHICNYKNPSLSFIVKCKRLSSLFLLMMFSRVTHVSCNCRSKMLKRSLSYMTFLVKISGWWRHAIVQLIQGMSLVHYLWIVPNVHEDKKQFCYFLGCYCYICTYTFCQWFASVSFITSSFFEVM